MSKLQNIRQIDQRKAKLNYKFSIRTGRNCLILGPSGSGKTEMAYQACAEENSNCIYWNLSVCERPELQGIPVVSKDGLTASYAAPQRLPFRDTRFHGHKVALQKMCTADPNLREHFQDELGLIEKYENMVALQDGLQYIGDEMVRGKVVDSIKLLNEALGDLMLNDSTILFDEVEKAPPEILQPLLEAVQMHSINGREMFVKTFLLTGNLPDEIVHSDPLSHALTNRCNVYELVPDFDVWQAWARPNGVKPLVLGFLGRPENRELFHKRPKNNEIFSYSYPTPRGWTEWSYMDSETTADEEFCKLMSEKDLGEFRKDLLAAKVGEEAAEKFDTWVEYYRELDPKVDEVFKGGYLDISEYPEDKQLIMCINLSARYTEWARSLINGGHNIQDKVQEAQERAQHIFGWIRQAHMDFQVASVRSTCDLKLYEDLGLHELDVTEELWREFNKLAVV